MDCCVSVTRKEMQLYNYVEGIINLGIYWDYNVKGDAVKGPVDCLLGGGGGCI